ncbi:protein phosphatase Slingshot isoform X2 [Atheta coriaria]|uniref:protein phosphatase Slingshot isoform X2 n=1 Tax=Dalotia coriaria TaxID=877792 RepID=UPI0031F47332
MYDCRNFRSPYACDRWCFILSFGEMTRKTINKALKFLFKKMRRWKRDEEDYEEDEECYCDQCYYCCEECERERMILEASAQSRWNLVVLYRPTRADSVPPPSRRSATGSAVATAAASTTCDARPARFPANMGNGMNKVLPGLYIGNYRDSKDAQQLEKHKITHILAVHDTARRLHQDKHYLCVMASDSPDQNLTQYFPVCNDFIHAARLRDGNVLIHCLAGMSRSVTVAVAYIMTCTNLPWKDALKVVRAGRAVANPNFGFQKQLQEYEDSKLFEERQRLKERFPSLALVSRDEEQCALMLNNYEQLILSRAICDGRCVMGQQCPTGVCRTSNSRQSRRRNSKSQREERAASLSRSPSVSSVRPRSGPAGLHSYTGNGGSSAPPSRSGSRVDLSYVGGTLTAPSTPQSSPPVSPIRRRTTVTRHVPLKEVTGT